MKTATIETDKGTISLELFDDKVPKTCENFVKLSTEGFYDGLTFHRVIDNFMIQTGARWTSQALIRTCRSGKSCFQNAFTPTLSRFEIRKWLRI